MKRPVTWRSLLKIPEPENLSEFDMVLDKNNHVIFKGTPKDTKDWLILTSTGTLTNITIYSVLVGATNHVVPVGKYLG